MRAIILALAGLPAMIVCQPSEVSPQSGSVAEKTSWKGKLILPRRGLDAPSMVLEQDAGKIRIRTWYERDIWLNIADLDIAEEELASDPIQFQTARIRANPADAASYKHRGIAWDLLKHEYDVAIMDFDESLRLLPNQPDVHLRRGIALYRLGKPDKAADALDAALRLDRTLAEAYFYRGHAMRVKWEMKGVDELETILDLPISPAQKTKAAKEFDEASKALEGDRRNYDPLLRGIEILAAKWRSTIRSTAASDEVKLKAKKDLAEALAELNYARQDYDEAMRHEPNAIDAARWYRTLVRQQQAKFE